MTLGNFIAKEQNVPPDEVMLLRHSNRMINKLKQSGASIEDDYTFVQPINSKYDFLADKQPPIKVVVVVVDDVVFGVYQVNGVAQIGTSRNLVSQNFIIVDKAEGHKEKPSKKFSMIKLSSASIGRSITGWSCPRYPVARSGHKMFDSVELV